jgi:hypothetical protein
MFSKLELLDLSVARKIYVQKLDILDMFPDMAKAWTFRPDSLAPDPHAKSSETTD